MFYKKAGLITYHSPMACSDFAEENISEFTKNNFFKATLLKLIKYKIISIIYKGLHLSSNVQGFETKFSKLEFNR